MDASPENLDELQSFMEKQVRLGELAYENTSIIGVDSDGTYYTESGQKGLLSEQRYLLTEPERVSFVTNSLFGDSTRMVFLIKVPDPIVIDEGDKSITITYYGIAQDMAELQPYFSCNAYGGQNGMYVLDDQGLKIFSGSENNPLKGYNLYAVLRKLDYLHDSSFETTQSEFEKDGVAYSNVVYEGIEYYYSLYHMDNAEWNMLLIIPSDYVATNTVELVNMTVKIFLAFAVVLICISAVFIFTLMARQQKIAVEIERRNSKKLEGLNEELKNAVVKAKNAVLLFCLDFAVEEEVQDLLIESGVDGMVLRPFFLSNLAVAIARTRTSSIPEDEESSILNGMNFLCAEDNELNAEILKELLHMYGATCTIYPDGEKIVEAFKSVKPNEYDAILMDVQMPNMNGLEATRAIRNSENPFGKIIPIIAMTANAFSEDVQHCLGAGMDAHIAKPLDIEVLEKTLRGFSVGGRLSRRKKTD